MPSWQVGSRKGSVSHVGPVRFYEFSLAGWLFIRGTLLEKVNDVSAGNLVPEPLAPARIWPVR